MDERLLVCIVNCLTGEIDLRKMNDEEFAQFEIDRIQTAEEDEQQKIEERLRKDNTMKLVSTLAESTDLTENEVAELLGLSFELNS